MINAIATVATKTGTAFSDTVAVDDTDEFVVTPEYRIAPLTADNSNVADVTTSPDTEWTATASFSVPVSSSFSTQVTSSLRIRDHPSLDGDIRNYFKSLEL